jgi:hypothetical protein
MLTGIVLLMYMLSQNHQIALAANGRDASDPDLPPASVSSPNTAANENGTIVISNRNITDSDVSSEEEE